MLVASDRFGDLEIEDDKVLEFPEGLLGFPAAKRFAMIDSHDTGVYFWLQSIDDPALAFLSVVPWPFFPDYEPELSDDVQQALAIDQEEDAIVLCLLTVQREQEAITANLLGPLVVNSHTRLGRQLVLAESGYSVRAPLAAA
ncbi:MAG: flagellar assembly protein FliW [Acidimicrobiia bacterium]